MSSPLEPAAATAARGAAPPFPSLRICWLLEKSSASTSRSIGAGARVKSTLLRRPEATEGAPRFLPLAVESGG